MTREGGVFDPLEYYFSLNFIFPKTTHVPPTRRGGLETLQDRNFMMTEKIQT